MKAFFKFHGWLVLILVLGYYGCNPKVEKKVQVDVLKRAKPDEVGISAKRLRKIETLLTGYQEKGWIPGAVALVARDGKIVYEKAFGFRNIEERDTLKTTDIFRIASMTKAITSTAVMLLYEDGLFLLDDPVSNYIPAFKDPKVLLKTNTDGTYTSTPAKSEITIRHLLTHTSGIGYGFTHPELKPLYDKAGIPDGFVVTQEVLGDMIEKLGEMPLLHDPGEKYTYGLNTDVLGYLVEIISGKPFDQFLENRLFKPLGMKDTHFYLPEDKLSRLAVVYAEDERGIAPSNDGRYNFPFEGGKKYFSGGAGLCSTAEDYAKFLFMYLNNGIYNGNQILSPKTIELIKRNQISDFWETNMFGLGFGITDEQGAARLPSSVGNMWWGGYFHTHFWMDPEEKLIGILMLQMYPVVHGDISEKFQVLVYQSMVE